MKIAGKHISAKTYDDLQRFRIKQYLPNKIMTSKEITILNLEAFLVQPGINIQGICDEAGIAKQYLNRCRKSKVLPGRKVLDKLVPILKKYGF